MKTSSSATVTFGAGHSLKDSEWCGDKPHGHRYTVMVTWEREGFPTADLAEWEVNRQRVLDLALELKNRELNKMLGAAVPNVFGVASFFMERLALNMPVVKVEVHEDSDPVAFIERNLDR